MPRDLTVAAVLVGIILLFIVCHSFKFVVNVYEAYLVFLSKLYAISLPALNIPNAEELDYTSNPGAHSVAFIKTYN